MSANNISGLRNIEHISDDMLIAMLHIDSRSKTILPEGRAVKASRGADWKQVFTRYDARPFMPTNPIVLCDVFSDGRLYSSEAEDLMLDPWDLADRFDMFQTCSGPVSYSFVSFRKRKHQPRAFIRPGCDRFWDVCHRDIYKSGAEDVEAAVFGWNTKRRMAFMCPVPEHKAVIFGGNIKDRDLEITKQLAICASVYEDSLVNWVATIRSESEFSVYSTEDHMKDLCDLRDAPLTDSGRRAAICHWVRGHKRNAEQGRVDIKKHIRGVTVFPLGDMQITITPPRGIAAKEARK